jgi:uncharacterized protein (DUF433 family)
MSTTIVDIGTLVTSTPGVNGGRPCVAGTRSSVQRISILYKEFGSVETLFAELPHLEPKQILAALTYYFANQAAIDAQIAEDNEEGLRLAEEDRLRRLAG